MGLGATLLSLWLGIHYGLKLRVAYEVARGDSLALCAFDGATTAGDYVQISSSVAGDCHDFGPNPPTSGQIVGRVLSTNGGAGTYRIELFTRR